MNRLKSVFIGVYPMLAMGVAGYAGWQLAIDRDVMRWAGPLATSVPFLLFLSYILAFKTVARTSGTFPGLNALAVAGVGLAGYEARHGPVAPLGLATAGAIGFALYSLWYSKLGRPATSRLEVGRPFPDLELKDVMGARFHTRTLRGRTALIFFYRGNWCPLCMAQVREVASRYRELVASGTRVLLISPQPHENTVALAKRFEVPFDFLTDEGNRVAQALGLEMKSGLPLGFEVLGYASDTVYPTVIVLDEDSVVRWLDQTDNYRVRPEPETFLGVLQELRGAGPASALGPAQARGAIR